MPSNASYLFYKEWVVLFNIKQETLPREELEALQLRRLRELCRRGQANVHVIGSEAYDACLSGQFTLERLGKGERLKRLKEMSTEMRKPQVKALLGNCEDTSLVDDELDEPDEPDPGSGA